MGQWATRRRRGAGPPADIYAIDATPIDLGNGIFQINYSGDIDDAWFANNAFLLEGVNPSVTVTQAGSDSLTVDFMIDAIGTSFIKYVGDAPNVRPQQIITFT